MQLRLLTASFFLLAAAMVSCTDHTSTQVASPQENPDPPINGGDGDIFVPPIDEVDPADPLDDDPDSNAGGGVGGSGGDTGGDGDGGGGGSGQSNNGGGGDDGGGGAPGSAVPEPGTMLLVGSGLAGLAYYRRRKDQPEVESEAE